MRKLIILGCMICLFATPVLAQDTLVLSGSDSKGVRDSLANLEQAYAKLGKSIVFEDAPHARSLENSNTGKTDGEVHRVKGIDKKFTGLVMIPVPVSSIEAMAYTKDKSIPINGWDSLKDLKIGILRGVKFAEAGTKGMKDVKVVKSADQLLKMLDAGRIDIVVIARTEGENALKAANLPGIQATEPPLQTLHLYHYLNKKHEALVPEVSKALEEVMSK